MGDLLRSAFGAWLASEMLCARGGASEEGGEGGGEEGGGGGEMRIYVCGDRNAAKELQAQILGALVQHEYCTTRKDAVVVLKSWLQHDRYLRV